jgi:hypothetical protein
MNKKKTKKPFLTTLYDLIIAFLNLLAIVFGIFFTVPPTTVIPFPIFFTIKGFFESVVEVGDDNDPIEYGIGGGEVSSFMDESTCKFKDVSSESLSIKSSFCESIILSCGAVPSAF